MKRSRIPLSDQYDTWYQNPLIRLAILAAVLVVLIIICVSVMGNREEETSAEAENSEETGVTAAPDGTFPGEKEDGSGEAGLMRLTEEMFQSSTETGWHYTHKGMWYSASSGLCYYNGWADVDGRTYHFDAEGYRDIGWTRIGGEAYCFDGQGVYQPDASTDKIVAFTFDDGPSQGMDQIIDLCNETGARVTFFMIGAQVEKGGNVIPNIMLANCELGNHSYSHSNMDNKTAEECAADFALCDEYIRSFSFGPESDVVRFPYGNISEENMQAVGKPCILWDIDSLDWESQDAASIMDIVYNQIDDGNIILMHDRYDATVEACRVLFPDLISRGYQLVTVEELSVAKGVEMQPGEVYYNF